MGRSIMVVVMITLALAASLGVTYGDECNCEDMRKGHYCADNAQYCHLDGERGDYMRLYCHRTCRLCKCHDVCGDHVCFSDGRSYCLENNLACPSGISIECRCNAGHHCCAPIVDNPDEINPVPCEDVRTDGYCANNKHQCEPDVFGYNYTRVICRKSCGFCGATTKLPNVRPNPTNPTTKLPNVRPNPTNRCPEGSFTVEKSNECFTLYDDVPHTWDDARVLCYSRGQRMASPSNDAAPALRKYLVNRFGGMKITNSPKVWIGARGDGRNMVLKDEGNKIFRSNRWHGIKHRGHLPMTNCVYVLVSYNLMMRNPVHDVFDIGFCGDSQFTLCEEL